MRNSAKQREAASRYCLDNKTHLRLQTPEVRKKAAESKRGIKRGPHTKEWNEKIASSRRGRPVPKLRGENHYAWKKDRTRIMDLRNLRNSVEWRVWRSDVFERDGYSCQECGVVGGNIEPHHIVSKAKRIDRVFDVSNGITLCRECHKKTFKREHELEEKYFSILSRRAPNL